MGVAEGEERWTLDWSRGIPTETYVTYLDVLLVRGSDWLKVRQELSELRGRASRFEEVQAERDEYRNLKAQFKADRNKWRQRADRAEAERDEARRERDDLAVGNAQTMELRADLERAQEALRQIAEHDLWEDTEPRNATAFINGKERPLYYRRVVTPAQRAREALADARERGEQ